MSSTPQKHTQKMCKSPKSAVVPNFHGNKSDKILLNEYENMSTTCTTVGSNNLHLVKKPQLITNMSPAYSNPSPNYPHSPYSSPAGLKSPSPQNLKPSTPQPNSFPVMQIIHNNHSLLARPLQTSQPQNVIKLKQHLNILPKPSASPQPSPKPSVSPQIVIPTNQQATIVPTAQPLLLNQMPLLTTPGVQFILRPQTKLPATQVQATASTATATPQGLIIQPGGQPLLQLQPPRSQSVVRVLTNGVQLAPPPQTTYVAQVPTVNQQGQVLHGQPNPSPVKKKPKKKKQKIDLANIMKLSGIGDEDDIQFESDTSQSESERNTPQPVQCTTSHSQQTQSHHQTQAVHHNVVQTHLNHLVQSGDGKKMSNIQISAVPQTAIGPATATPLVQVLNQSFQSGMIPTSQAHQSIPFNSFITPNFTINNGLMVQQRSSGGFKLTLGEDGRLILQHDPTLNQDLQSQILLQSLFGLNPLLLQPSIDQQVHSQTVQTIQQQSVQTIQQQTVQSQTIQTVQQQTVQPQSVQHSLQTIQQTIQPPIQTVQPQTVQQTVQQTIQHQTVQSQPLSALQQHTQPMQIVQPQPIQNLNQSIQSQTVHSIQSQIQGQLQSLLQSQLHPQNISQGQTLSIQSQPIQVTHSQSLPTVQTSQPLIVNSQPMHISQSISQPITIQSQPMQALHTRSQQSMQDVQSNIMHPIHSQPTQTVHSQGMQTVQTQSMLTSQSVPTSQPVLKVQPFQKSQPPVQTVHPQPVQSVTHQQQPNQSSLAPSNDSNHASGTAPTSYVVNLTPNELEQLKRNGQVTVNGQTIFMKTNASVNKIPEINMTVDNNKAIKLSPKIKPVKKINKITNVKGILQDGGIVKNVEKVTSNMKESKSSLVTALQAPPKHSLQQIQPQQPLQPVVQKTTSQPSALVQPSVQVSSNQAQQSKIKIQQHQVQQKLQLSPTPIQIHSSTPSPDETPSNHDVERLLGRLIDDTNNQLPPSSAPPSTSPPNHVQPPQKVQAIQLTPQKQQHLRNIQLQMHTLNARLTPGDSEGRNALKLLIQEQQKILATGKLLPPDSVFFHNNQLTINPSSLSQPSTKTEAQSNCGQTFVRCTGSDSVSQVVNTSSTQSTKILPVSSENKLLNNTNMTQNVQVVSQHSVSPKTIPPLNTPGTRPSLAPPSAQSQQHHRFLSTFTKAQLIEQQMNTDQNGAIKPDVNTPFRDKTDACKRLIRYHCFDQPVLSSKDLNKADEIFELTAKHFIGKFSKMIDKYRYLRLKESMRPVQTSELMMLDRLFLSDEQQSLMRLRQESQDSQQPLDIVQPPQSQVPIVSSVQQSITRQSIEVDQQEEYDEWACIQKELGCLPVSQSAATEESPLPVQESNQGHKRSASSDSRLETLKRFRVDKHQKKGLDCIVGTNVSCAGEQTSPLNTQLHNDEHFGTSVSQCQNVQCSPGNSQQHPRPTQAFQTNSQFHVSNNNLTHSSQHGLHQIHSMQRAHSHHIQQPSGTIHNHNTQLTQHNGLHGAQHVAQHNMSVANPPQSLHQNHSRHVTHVNNVHSIATQQQHHHHRSIHNLQQHFSTHHQHVVQSGGGGTLHATQHITHTVHHQSTQHMHNATQHAIHTSQQQVYGGPPSGNNTNGTENTIDEQVQSAIDSILNLQQSSALDIEDAVNSILS